MGGFTLRADSMVQIDLFSTSGLVVHAFTTRHGGVSQGDYSSLNMSFRVGDRPKNVLVNRTIICKILGVRLEDLVAAEQVHGDFISVVNLSHRGRGAKTAKDAIPATDALITGERGVLLSTYHADCVPVFLLDPVQKIAGVVHAGWKGTYLHITKKTVFKMQEVFGSRPKDCLAGIGPAVGPCCYEVDQTVVRFFKNSFINWEELFKPASSGRWFLNLWEANRRLLLNAGLKEEHIAVAGLCTCCHNDLFFSYRASKGNTGRMAALIMLL